MAKNQTIVAVIWMLGGMFSLFAVGIIGKLLGGEYSTFELMFYRSAIAFPLFCAFALLAGKFRDFHIRAIPLHFLRNITHFTAQNLWFYALAALPLAVVITFEFTTPAWVIVIAAFALGEGFGWRRLAIIVLSLLGVVLITDPRSVPMSWPLFTAILCAVGFALTMIFTKKLTKQQNVYEILFMMTLLQTIFAGAILFMVGDIRPVSLSNAHLWLLLAFFGTSSHFCITTALSLADASVVSPVDLLRLPLSILVGYLYFQESISWVMALGTLLLLAANYMNIRRKAR